MKPTSEAVNNFFDAGMNSTVVVVKMGAYKQTRVTVSA